MSSLLSQCEGCGTTIAIGHPCGTCRDKQPTAAFQGAAMVGSVLEYQDRKKVHDLNSRVVLLVQFATALVGLLTAICVFFVCFRGSILAFVLVGIFTLASAVLGWITLGANKYFPVDLNCPGCESRLDGIGRNFQYCPSCDCQLQ